MPEAAVRVAAALQSGENPHRRPRAPGPDRKPHRRRVRALRWRQHAEHVRRHQHLRPQRNPQRRARVRQAMLYLRRPRRHVETPSPAASAPNSTARSSPPAASATTPTSRPIPTIPQRPKELLTEAGYPDGFTITGSATTGRYFPRPHLHGGPGSPSGAQVGIIVEMEYPESSRLAAGTESTRPCRPS